MLLTKDILRLIDGVCSFDVPGMHDRFACRDDVEHVVVAITDSTLIEVINKLEDMRKTDGPIEWNAAIDKACILLRRSKLSKRLKSDGRVESE